MASGREMRELRRELERSGFAVEHSRGGHLRFFHPRMDGPVFASATQSDHHATANLRAMLRRKMQPAAADAPEPEPACEVAVPEQLAPAPQPMPAASTTEPQQQQPPARPQPRETPRQLARRIGQQSYTGLDCWRGHGGKRYTASGNCVACSAAEAASRRPAITDPAAPDPRKEARQAGQRIYRGKPCAHGHEGQRYRSTGRCIVCTREDAHRQHDAQAARRRALHLAAASSTPRQHPEHEPKHGQQRAAAGHRPVRWWPAEWTHWSD